MTKTKVITLRVSEDTKRLISEAARTKGLSMTTLIERETTKAAQRIIDNPPVPSGACPGFFKALCAEARRGGQNSYKWAAYELTRHVGGLVNETAIDDLIDLVDADADYDDAAVILWFEAHLPRCMALVPKRRRDQFLSGVYAFHDDLGIEPSCMP